MKKKLVAAVAGFGVVATAGAAWAFLGGQVVVPDGIQGLVQGSGPVSCQTGGVTFTVPDPVWNSSAQDYVVSTIGYSGITTACVNLGTADLLLNVTSGGATVTSAQATNMSSASGTLTLTTPLDFDTATSGQYNYFVRDN